MFRIGAARLLALSVVLIAGSNLTFAWLSAIGQPNPTVLTIAISVDNLAGGMSGSIFIAFLSGLTNTAYTATQYALFTSLMLLRRWRRIARIGTTPEPPATRKSGPPSSGRQTK